MDSWYPTKMFANAGPSGESITTPSVCLYVVSLKLNSTDDVALSISSINTAWGMGGAEEESLYKASVHMPIVSLRGTVVNRLEMSNEHKWTSFLLFVFTVQLFRYDQSLLSLDRLRFSLLLCYLLKMHFSLLQSAFLLIAECISPYCIWSFKDPAHHIPNQTEIATTEFCPKSLL